MRVTCICYATSGVGVVLMEWTVRHLETGGMTARSLVQANLDAEVFLQRQCGTLKSSMRNTRSVHN
jgi:hypothetical protein